MNISRLFVSICYEKKEGINASQHVVKYLYHFLQKVVNNLNKIFIFSD